MQLIVKIQIGFEFYFASMPTNWLSTKGSKPMEQLQVGVYDY